MSAYKWFVSFSTKSLATGVLGYGNCDVDGPPADWSDITKLQDMIKEKVAQRLGGENEVIVLSWQRFGA